jgi:hypothetical protein
MRNGIARFRKVFDWLGARQEAQGLGKPTGVSLFLQWTAQNFEPRLIKESVLAHGPGLADA